MDPGLSLEPDFNLRAFEHSLFELRKSRDLYEQLDKTLHRIIQLRKHPIMVPFGSKAFFDGSIVHTNDVTVAIGENYFIKCSVSHARGIIERRRIDIEERISDIQTQLKIQYPAEEQLNQLKSKPNLENQLTDDGEKIVDIVEPYYSDEEKPVKDKEDKTTNTVQPIVDFENDEEILKFYEKLEEEEENKTELEKKDIDEKEINKDKDDKIVDNEPKIHNNYKNLETGTQVNIVEKQEKKDIVKLPSVDSKPNSNNNNTNSETGQVKKSLFKQKQEQKKNFS